MTAMPLTLNRYQYEADLCKDSYFEFIKRFWSVIIPEEPVWNWHIPYLAEEFQMVAERVFLRKPKLYDLIINVPPGSTKSTIFSIFSTPWCCARDPTIRTINSSYASALSLRLGTQARTVILSDKYKNLFPHIILEDESKSHLTNTKGGERLATSVGATVTGFHAHLLLSDDLINPLEALSKVTIEKANTWMDQTLSERKVDKALTPHILIQQRLAQNDTTGHALKKVKTGTHNGTKIKHICLPASLSKDVKPRSVRRFYTDGLLDPIRIPQSEIDDALGRLGEYGLAGQYQQNPIPAGGGLFKIDKIRIAEPPSRFAQMVRYWDKAGTMGGGAYTVGCKMAKDRQGRFWILDIQRGQWEALEREDIVKNTADMDGSSVHIGLEQEPGSGGKESAQATVRRLAGYVVRSDRPVGNKALRADPFAIQFNAGNVLMVKGNWNFIYMDELQAFPYSTYKDQVDASSGAFAMLTRINKYIGGLR